MHEFFKAEHSPGRRSEAYKSGMEAQPANHAGNWDRNNLVAAMLEIKLSLTGHPLDQTTFDTLELWDRICGGATNVALTDIDHTGAGPAGYRVPTSDEWDPDFETYENGDIPITDFSPIVAYGSLEMLRSMRMNELSSCPKDLSHSDSLLYQYCENDQQYLSKEMLTRMQYSPFSLQRDVWCNPHSHLSIEQAAGNPEYFDLPLYDTGVKDRFKINNLVVKALERGEEDIEDKAWVKRSLRSWVYVTSSADRHIRAGMYRLSELALFREQACNTLPNVQCGAGVAFKEVQNFPPPDLPPSLLTVWKQQGFETRTVTTNDEVRLNTASELIDGIGVASSWLSGKEAMLQFRCSELVDAFFGFNPCQQNPYQFDVARPQCGTSDLPLQSRPTAYGSKHWLFRLDFTLPSPSPPPPPPGPSPPPGPDPPSPPPHPPKMYSQAHVMEAIRQLENDACTSVYYLSATTRCERLAIGLTTRWLMEFNKPPALPPVIGTSPSPPPLLPPSPAMPAGFVFTSPTSATLSTFRVPMQLPEGENMDEFGFFVESRSAFEQSLGEYESNKRACIPDAPLGCHSGSLPSTCLNGARRCGTGEENALDPFVEVTFKPGYRRYIWGVQVWLPRNTQLSELFKGQKKIELFGTRDEPLPCHQGSDEVVGIPEDYKVLIICTPPEATDSQLYAMSEAYRLRITLVGEFRQVWMDKIFLIERDLENVPGLRPAPTPPPPLPEAPPGSVPSPPPAPPDGSVQCGFQSRTFIDDSVVARIEHEPCGITKEACCMHKKLAEGRGIDAFSLDDAGCCVLYNFEPEGTTFSDVVVVTDEARFGNWLATSGVGA